MARQRDRAIRLARPDELHKLVAIDDEASELYAQAGLEFAFEADHPFVMAESVRWADANERGLAHVAVDGRPATENGNGRGRRTTSVSGG